jgi:hypothetical protein
MTGDLVAICCARALSNCDGALRIAIELKLVSKIRLLNRRQRRPVKREIGDRFILLGSSINGKAIDAIVMSILTELESLWR